MLFLIMGFIADKNEGETFEKNVIEMFNREWGFLLKKNTNIKGVDLVHPLFSVEVKWDRRVEETGNTFIEISSLRSLRSPSWQEEKQKTPSWLFAPFDIPPMFFVIGCSKETLVFNTEHLKEKVLEWASDWVFPLKNGWDWWKSRGLLVEWEVLKEEALHIFIK